MMSGYSDDPSQPYGNSQVGPPPPRYGNSGVGPPPRLGPSARPPRRSSNNNNNNGGQRHTNAPPPHYSSNRNNNSIYRDNEDDDAGNTSNYDVYENEPEQPQDQRRYKYSTANMQQSGNCRKYCCIVLLFLLFMAFSIGLSMLINKIFFSEDDSSGENDNGIPDDLLEGSENETFPYDKSAVDQACSTGSFDKDAGETCKQVCRPMHAKCCKPFDQDKLYATNDSSNTTKVVNPTNSSNATTDYPTISSNAPTANPTISSNATADYPTNSSNATTVGPTTNSSNTTSEEGTTLLNETCSFDTELHGCVSYSKCHSVMGFTESAPGALQVYCTEPRLSQDRQTCEDICTKPKCCLNQGEGKSCLGSKLDYCLDYAPCQNLRDNAALETAPHNLDTACRVGSNECNEYCKKAECCSLDHPESCFQDNFVTCLTYVGCNYSNETSTKISVAPQFSNVSQPPQELVTACDERNEMVHTPKTCDEYCQDAGCCFKENLEENCFKHDPLGCLAWFQQCQSLGLTVPRRN